MHIRHIYNIHGNYNIQEKAGSGGRFPPESKKKNIYPSPESSRETVCGSPDVIMFISGGRIFFITEDGVLLGVSEAVTE